MFQMTIMLKICRTELIETHVLLDIAMSTTDGEFVSMTGMTGWL